MLICIRHPGYDGSDRPVLACKTCCSIFITALKERVAAGKPPAVDTYQWLEEKRRQAERVNERASQINYGFSPSSI